MQNTKKPANQTSPYTQEVRATTLSTITELVYDVYGKTPFVYSVFEKTQELYIVEMDNGEITEVFRRFIRNETLIGHISVDSMTIAAFFRQQIEKDGR